ncbi:hypothetical protein EJ05DRAFT_485937 [Pseudovirgaria hyperparasitica]|uniref:Exonuclease domain-containing protein n=1 Tax=Pseudovirgaria hyperparasitica TaxID=470096 RepID=A0A6A6W4P7_9PEZI|nr:uncharacterized protein EJ05DRAFT_485937 [Pseudovirgaria hyperparasitica]KAF2757852.1 hypothetical protein EJ05DRAFT_485937 [Pseudovirgaria hyperparasitica]
MVSKYWMDSANLEPSSSKRAAVVLDCEFAHKDNSRHVARIAAVDALTAETLFDFLVHPEDIDGYWEQEYAKWKRSDMDPAVATGVVLDGVYGALLALTDFIDSNTIILGHSVHHDLNALRLVHRRVVDSQILISERITQWNNRIRSVGIGLQVLCKNLIGIKVQVGSESHHSPVEDSLAAREAILALLFKPEYLERWRVKIQRDEAKQEVMRKKFGGSARVGFKHMDSRSKKNTGFEASLPAKKQQKSAGSSQTKNQVKQNSQVTQKERVKQEGPKTRKGRPKQQGLGRHKGEVQVKGQPNKATGQPNVHMSKDERHAAKKAAKLEVNLENRRLRKLAREKKREAMKEKNQRVAI